MKLTPVDMSPAEFERIALQEGWQARPVELLLQYPIIQVPFQMGKWLVTLVDR